VMFPVIILQSLYRLPDDQMGYQSKGRRAFEGFVSGGDTNCQMPDAKTIWLCKERFKEHGVARKVLRKFNEQLNKANLMARSGQTADASFAEVPRQRNSRDDNGHIKKGNF